MRAIMADDKEGGGIPRAGRNVQRGKLPEEGLQNAQKLFKKEGGFNFNLIIALYNRAITKRGPQNEPLRI